VSVRAAARWLTTAVFACQLFACRGQLRLDDDGGSPSDDAGLGEDTQAPAIDGAPSAGCANDVDCHLSTLHCDPLSGACVACLSDDQCTDPTKHRCDAALHRCVECGVDGDCGTGKVCVPGTRRCAATCHQLTDCVFSGYFCDTTRSICVRCTGDSVCSGFDPDTPLCDLDGQCVECLSDAVCPATKPRCDRTTGSCVMCLGASDCKGATPLCDPKTSTCVSG
jgi:hypothetical protein